MVRSVKITALKTYKFSVPTAHRPANKRIGSTHKSWLFLKIETDSGLCGWGEGSGEWLTSPVEATLMALAYGDQTTNMLQPFWALPLLGITGLRAGQIMGYTMVVMVLSLPVFALPLLLL